MRILIALLFGLPAIALAQQIAIGEYAAHPAGNDFSITAGPDGALWFTEFSANKIGRIATSGTVTEYAVPTHQSSPAGIAAGPDGALWFTEHDANKIGRITTAGAFTEYRLPDKLATWPTGITTGPDGALWFTEPGEGQIGRITTAGAITEYRLPNLYSSPQAITAGPDGALWFTEFGTNKIGRINTGGAVTEYPVPTPDDFPLAITAGPDRALWFIESANKIGRITTAGAITEFPLPTGPEYGGPQWITTGPDGALWFTQLTWGTLGRVTTAGAFSWYAVPNEITAPSAITTGPDGELWFTANGSGQIGEAAFVTANLSVTPATGSYGATLSFLGTGFGPGEKVQVYVGGVGSAVLAAATTNSSGSFTATGSVPQSVDGARIFLGAGQNSGKLGAAPFLTTPRLILSPDAGSPGNTVAVAGYGFGSFQTVSLYWNDTNTALGTVTADVHGTFSGSTGFKFTVPVGASPGADTVIATGSYPTINVSHPFTVN
jgi:virginiamycin B lyase